MFVSYNSYNIYLVATNSYIYLISMWSLKSRVRKQAKRQSPQYVIVYTYIQYTYYNKMSGAPFGRSKQQQQQRQQQGWLFNLVWLTRLIFK